MDLLLAKSELLLKLGRDEEAIPFYQAFITLHPSVGRAYYGLSKAFSHIGKSKEAFAMVSQGVLCEPNFVHNWTLMGFLLRESEHFAAALTAIQQAIRIDPADGKSWFHLGVVFGKMNRFDEAIQAFEQAITLHPEEEGEAWIQMSLSYTDLGQHESALEAARNAYLFAPDDPESQDIYASALTRCKQYHDALLLYEALIQRFPTDSRFRINLGLMYNRWHLWTQAIDVLTDAVPLLPSEEPERTEYTDILTSSLALAYYGVGQYEQSLTFCKEALVINPTDAVLWVLQSHILEQQGDNTAANHAMRTAMAIDGDAEQKLHEFFGGEERE